MLSRQTTRKFYRRCNAQQKRGDFFGFGIGLGLTIHPPHRHQTQRAHVAWQSNQTEFTRVVVRGGDDLE